MPTRKSLFPEDDALPTWLHTALLFIGVSPFGIPLTWWGVQAIVQRHLEPLSGPEFGQWFFGRSALDGSEAVWAGISLVVFGVSFFAIAVSFMRASEGNRVLKLLPWILVATSIVVSLPAGHHP